MNERQCKHLVAWLHNGMPNHHGRREALMQTTSEAKEQAEPAKAMPIITAYKVRSRRCSKDQSNQFRAGTDMFEPSGPTSNLSELPMTPICVCSTTNSRGLELFFKSMELYLPEGVLPIYLASPLKPRI
jgi:hypothetical protein